MFESQSSHGILPGLMHVDVQGMGKQAPGSQLEVGSEGRVGKKGALRLREMVDLVH